MNTTEDIRLLDQPHIAEMHDIFGETGFLELFDLFREECGSLVTRLADLQGTELADTLHGIRGSAENIGFRRLVILCRRSEEAARAGDTVDIAQVHAAYDMSCEALSTQLST